VARPSPKHPRTAPAWRHPPLYYGWTIVGTLGLTELISWGIVYYAFSVMLAPMQAELGWGRAHLTGAFSLALLCSGIAAVPVGRLLDLYGARWLMTIGSCGATLLVVAWAQVDSLLSLYLVWIGLGVAMAAILYEPAFAVVATWFDRKRQHALTVLTLGGGLASVVFVPLTTALVERLGWRPALMVLAAVLGLGTIPLHALILRRHPHDLGLVPDGAGEPSAVSSERAGRKPGVHVRAALRGATFWWIAIAFAASVFASVAVNVHLIAFLTERGYGAGFRATAAALLGGAQLPGRVVFAPLSRWFSRRQLATTLLLLQAGAVLCLVAVPSTYGIVLFTILFGVGSGALTPTRAALIADVYGVAQYGSINGALALATTIARALGPVSAGLLYTVSGSYLPLWWALIGLTLLGTIAMTRVQQPDVAVGDGA
jgi:MFS family permease